jgi:hypothetical protein
MSSVTIPGSCVGDRLPKSFETSEVCESAVALANGRAAPVGGTMDAAGAAVATTDGAIGTTGGSVAIAAAAAPEAVATAAAPLAIVPLASETSAFRA